MSGILDHVNTGHFGPKTGFSVHFSDHYFRIAGIQMVTVLGSLLYLLPECFDVYNWRLVPVANPVCGPLRFGELLLGKEPTVKNYILLPKNVK